MHVEFLKIFYNNQKKITYYFAFTNIYYNAR